MIKRFARIQSVPSIDPSLCLLEQGIPLLPVEVLEQDLNREFHAPHFLASAVKGTNVVVTLKKIISLTIASIKKELL